MLIRSLLAPAVQIEHKKQRVQIEHKKQRVQGIDASVAASTNKYLPFFPLQKEPAILTLSNPTQTMATFICYPSSKRSGGNTAIELITDILPVQCSTSIKRMWIPSNWSPTTCLVTTNGWRSIVGEWTDRSNTKKKRRKSSTHIEICMYYNL